MDLLTPGQYAPGDETLEEREDLLVVNRALADGRGEVEQVAGGALAEPGINDPIVVEIRHKTLVAMLDTLPIVGGVSVVAPEQDREADPMTLQRGWWGHASGESAGVAAGPRQRGPRARLERW